MRAALLNGAGFHELLPTMILLLVTGLMLIPIGMFIFGKAEYYAKKKGKLKRSG